MKISLSWLRDYLTTSQTALQLTETLTRSGLEVKSITTHGAAISKVVAAQILESTQHPNADRLSVCKVDDGSGTPRQIVCGAKNYKVGDKILLALPGALLPGDLKIKVGKLRGVESEGMMCSSKELGLGEGVEGLHILPPETVIGTELSALFPTDEILELEITPNRPDWLGLVGVAREAAAFGAGEFLWQAPILSASHEDPQVITIEATEASSFYSVQRITDITVKPSPAWLAGRLESIGARAINNVVDIANYVMFETGHPLHTFDAAKIKGALTVRFAKPGETLASLDGFTHKLRASDLVIADDCGPQALAGIIGGVASSVSETTTSILLESAVFNPSLVRASARAHGITTDAAYRFERGTEAVTALEASVRATSLIVELAGGVASQELVRAGAVVVPTIISLRHDRCRQVLGTEISDEQINSYLKKLGLTENKMGWQVPAWRLDLTREADLIEEIARLHGMENIASRSLNIPAASSQTDKTYDASMALRRRLVGCGFYEARTSTLVAREESSAHAIALRNPMGEQQSVLRTSLLSGLQKVVQHNFSQGAPSIRIFEFGKVFQTLHEKNIHEESLSLAMIMTGAAKPISWRGEAQRSLDLYDLKGVIDQLVPGKISYRACASETLQAEHALALRILCENQVCGYIALMAPAAARELMLSGQEYPVAVAELDFTRLQFSLATDAWKNGSALTKFPSVTRDLALIADKTLPYASLEKVLLESGEILLQSVIPFDVFTDPKGEKIPAEKKSIALSLTFHHNERTLTTEEVSQAVERLVKRLQESLKVEIRS